MKLCKEFWADKADANDSNCDHFATMLRVWATFKSGDCLLSQMKGSHFGVFRAAEARWDDALPSGSQSSLIFEQGVDFDLPST